MATFPQGLTNIDRRCDNAGERAVLHQLKRCLSDDFLVWHNVPVGDKKRFPDFIILSPRQGILVLEVKHWKRSTLVNANKQDVEIQTPRGLVMEANPLRQARECMMELVDVLQRDPALVHEDGHFKGKLLFPYGWGAVFSGLRRQDVNAEEFAHVFAPHQTLMRDDLDESISVSSFQNRLWGMFTMTFPHTLTMPERDRIRWHVFPEVRVSQASLFDESDQTKVALQLPDLMQVMDLQQEQVARTLGDGHRIIHGVAGSGKTMILVYRAQYLAQAARPDRPVLILCYNKALAARLRDQMQVRGISDRVLVRTFHSWCSDLTRTYQLEVPSSFKSHYVERMADATCRAVETGFIPGGQYLALLIDEAHDFEDAWLRMAAKMVSPDTNSLLILYDDAQSIYQKKRKKFNFASVGIQAQGRASILKMNYRNTAEVLTLAMHCAQSLLSEREETDDQMPVAKPSTAGRRGPMPELFEAANPRNEALMVVEQIVKAIDNGTTPGDIAVMSRTWAAMDAVGSALQQRGIAMHSNQESSSWKLKKPSEGVNLYTLHGCKGLEFQMVCIVGLHTMPHGEEPLDEEVRLLYVGMTRSTQKLLLSSAGDSVIVQRVRNALEAVSKELA